MKKVIQKTDILLKNLSNLETDWKDDFAIEVIEFLDEIKVDDINDSRNLTKLLELNFEVASTIFRLFLEKSKDEYTSILKELIPEKGMIGKKGFVKDKNKYIEVFEKLLLNKKIIDTINKDYSWKDIIVERLKAGRGSAIKGQKRGRQLEDFVESIIKKVYKKYDPRCSFIGMTAGS